MIRTLGLTHIALAVKDVKRASAFYQGVFGMQEMYHQEDFIQVQTPGSKDIIVFEKKSKNAGKAGGVIHFGFRLVDAADIETVAATVEQAGGKVIDKGEFLPGEPYVFFRDL